ncbi:MAG: tetratricopeptide repeat protein [Candidatus Ventricola sp.]
MSNVITISRTSDYLVSRAAKHRRAGRYDEAMALLGKARNQFGIQEDIEMEAARVYTEMGCDEEAARSYLRVVRRDGAHKAEALLDLSLLSAQRGDFDRAVSYYEQFLSCKEKTEVSGEMASALGRQLLEELNRPRMRSRRTRARMLEHRAASRLQEGKTAAAQHLMEHSLRLHETARGYTMLACCHLLRMQLPEAVDAASRAHRMAPGRVQTLCVLSDAYAAMGEAGLSRRAMCLAAMRAREPDDLFSVAMESAKHGDDALTMRMTKKLLAREPYHTHGMKLRACALLNLGRTKEASRLFGRLCGLLPEDTVCEFFYRLSREEKTPTERFSLGVDVTHEEGVNRAAEIISRLYISPDEICADPASLQRVCRLCEWALHSPMAGSHTKMVALILLTAIPADAAREVLLDALTDPLLADSVKLNILQVLTAKEGFKPYCVDIGGRLVRLAAGGISTQPAHSSMANSQIVQRASDALSGAYPDAPQALLQVFLRYLEAYPQPKGREEDACAAALEALYGRQAGRAVDERSIARRNGISVRLLHRMLRRFERCMQEKPDEPSTTS